MSSHTHKHHHDPEKMKAIVNRLSKAIGHLESVKRMVEDDRDCSEVLVQLAAVRDAAGSRRVRADLQVRGLSGPAHRLYELQARQGLRGQRLGRHGELPEDIQGQGLHPRPQEFAGVQLPRSRHRLPGADHTGAAVERAAL